MPLLNELQDTTQGAYGSGRPNDLIDGDHGVTGRNRNGRD